MKRLVLLLMLVASPSLAAKGLVVNCQSGFTPSNAAMLACSGFHATYETLGMDVEYVRQNALKPGWFKNAIRVEPGGATTQYDYLIVENYIRGAGSCNAGSPCATLDSAFTAAGWPLKPALFLTNPTVPTINMWSGGGTGDSTGFGVNPPTSVLFQQRMEYAYPYATGGKWHCYGGFPRMTLDATRPGPGIQRVVLLETTTQWRTWEVDFGGLATLDYDATATTLTPDTVTMLARYKYIGDPNVIVQCNLGAETNGRIEGSIRRLLLGLAMIDSTTNNGVFFQKRRGPIVFGFHVNGFGGTGRYDASDQPGYDSHIGIFCPGFKAVGDTCDSAFVKATIQLLQSRGIRASVGVQMNPDSMTAQLRWIRDLWTNAHVFPYEVSGFGSGFTGGNASNTRPYDAFGANRFRRLLPNPTDDPRDGCDSCRTFNGGFDTTSVYCMLKWQRQAVADYFGAGRIDPVWAAPREDWTPTQYTRSGGNLDSLIWVLWLSGIKGMRVGNMGLANSAGTTSALAGAPRGWMRNLTAWPVRDPATNNTIGTFWFLPSRDSEARCSMIISEPAAHDNMAEFLQGLLIGDWYFASRSPVYVNGHDFFSRTVIVELTPSWFGGGGQAGNTWQPARWFTTNMAGFLETLNALAGRTVMRTGYGNEVVDWLNRAGIRN